MVGWWVGWDVERQRAEDLKREKENAFVVHGGWMGGEMVSWLVGWWFGWWVGWDVERQRV